MLAPSCLFLSRLRARFLPPRRLPGALVGLIGSLLLAAVGPLAAQPRPRPDSSPALDSMRRLLAHTPPDTTRLNLLEELLQESRRRGQLAEGAEYAHAGSALAHQLGAARQEAFFLVEEGALATGAANYELATALFQRALRVAEKARLFNRSYPARAAIGLANVAGAQDNFLTAAAYSRQALRYARRITTSVDQRLTLEGIALSTLTQTYVQRLEREGRADSLVVQARRYGQQLVEVARQQQAAGNRTAATGLSANWWKTNSDLHAFQGRLDSALVLGERAAAAYEQIGALVGYTTVQQHLINVEARAGRHVQAAARARATGALAHQMGLTLVQADCYASLATSLDALGDGHGAYRASARALTMRDSLLSAEQRQVVSEMQVRFETERKEARIRELTQQRALTAERVARQQQRLWSLLTLAGAVLLVVVAVAVYLRQRAAAARREAEYQLRARLAADLHDEVGGLLTRVSLFAELAQETPEPALLGELLTESRAAAATVRDIIWSVDTSADTLGALADRLRDLLDQAARASGWQTRFELLPATADPATRLRPDVRQHLYLIGREAVTNALKHGPPVATLTLLLTVEKGGALTLDVRHDGPPVPPLTVRASQGLRNMAARAAQMGSALAVCGPISGGGWEVRVTVG